jgi:hypothetical protein
MLSVRILTIPHKKQRYPTCGDWWWTKKGDLEIRISDVGNWRFEFLIAYHELAEAMICKCLDIKQEDVDAFDIRFEEERKMGIHGEDDEPGDSEEAPYRVPHFWATTIERMMAMLLMVNWEVYANTVEALYK